MLVASQNAQTKYVVASWDLDTDVPGARSRVSSMQLMLVQMAKLAALIAHGLDLRSGLLSLISDVEANHNELMNGNALSGVDHTDPTTSSTGVGLMEDVWSLWETEKVGETEEVLVMGYKASLESLATHGYTDPSQIAVIESELTTLSAALIEANDFYSTTTMTTLTPINMTVPINNNAECGPRGKGYHQPKAIEPCSKSARAVTSGWAWVGGCAGPWLSLPHPSARRATRCRTLASFQASLAWARRGRKCQTF